MSTLALRSAQRQCQPMRAPCGHWQPCPTAQVRLSHSCTLNAGRSDAPHSESSTGLLCETLSHAPLLFERSDAPAPAGFVSGSADHELKFWEWQLTTSALEADGSGGAPARRLGIRHTRTLKMTDDVLCVRISPNGALLSTLCLARALTEGVLCQIKGSCL